ncbi:MAG: hypothetical protein ACK4NT_05965, partial [Candidatus Omnitrophota bacterium]
LVLNYYLKANVLPNISLWQGNSNQVRFIQGLVEDNKIKSRHFGSMATAIDVNIRRALDWNVLNMGYEDVVLSRESVEGLISRGNIRFDNNETYTLAQLKGNSGQITFFRLLREAGYQGKRLQTTGMGNFFSALEADWVKASALDWNVLNMGYTDVVLSREAVENLVNNKSITFADGTKRSLENLKNNKGQIEFFYLLRDKGYQMKDGVVRKLETTSMGAFFSALETDWVKPEILNWNRLNMGYTDVVLSREAVEGLVKNSWIIFDDKKRYEIKEFMHNEGQIKFVKLLYHTGYQGRKLQETYLANFLTAIEKEWRERLNWTFIFKNIDEV